MAEFIPFGRKIEFALLFGRRDNRNLFYNLQIEAGESVDFLRVIGQKSDRRQPQVLQNLQTNTVISRVRLEAEFVIGFDGVVSLVLQLIGLEFCQESDPAPFLREIDHRTRSCFVDHPHRHMQLIAAVAAQ